MNLKVLQLSVIGLLAFSLTGCPPKNPWARVAFHTGRQGVGNVSHATENAKRCPYEREPWQHSSEPTNTKPSATTGLAVVRSPAAAPIQSGRHGSATQVVG